MERMKILTTEVDAFIKEWNNEKSYIIANTSGSTGTPKVIRLSKKLVAESALRTINFFSIDSSSSLHLCLSPSYIAGKMVIVRAILSGAELTYEPPTSAPLKSHSSDKEIALLSVVGSQLHGLSNNIIGSGARIRNILIGGAPMNDIMRNFAITGNWSAFESYGMTETASHVALRKVTSDGENPFNALHGISFSTDSRDCLVINMPHSEKIITNDCVKLIDNYTFHLIGRDDNVIISGGLKIHPEEIENLISGVMRQYGNFYITSRLSDKWGSEVVLIVETDRTLEYINDKLLPKFRELLKPHEIPRHIICGEIKKTNSGKIIRQKF